MDELMSLGELLTWLETGSNIRISIHDISGILHNKKELMLDSQHSIHCAPCCAEAKKADGGLKRCLRCKLLSIKKALKSQEAYHGRCHAGVLEIVQPVFKNSRPVAVIYISNLWVEGSNPRHSPALLGTMALLAEKDLDHYYEMLKIIKSYLLLVAAKYNARGAESHLSPIYTEVGHWAVKAAKEYVDLYYDRPIRLSHIAKEYFINEEYLCRLFKQQIGKSFTTYVNDIRIDHAKELLLSEKSRIIDIAARVGLDNVSYFNKLFRKKTGTTPTAFVRSQQNGSNKT